MLPLRRATVLITQLALPNKIPNILTPPFPTMMILPPKDEVVPTRLHSSQMFEVPVNPTTKIARDVVLEIGSGLGDWILYRAKANPNINYVFCFSSAIALANPKLDCCRAEA